MKSFKPNEKIPDGIVERIGTKAKELYNKEYAENYRESDNRGVDHESHLFYCHILANLASKFKTEISALDLGCGTGRYFRCLKNVKKIVGVDISLDMLRLARNPVKKEDLGTADIELICADILSVAFPPQSFDLIYSVGVFGEHAPFNHFLCNLIFSFLKPGGKVFFTVKDASSPQGTSWKREIATSLYPLLPKLMKIQVDLRIGNFTVTEHDLQWIIQNAAFGKYEITKRTSEWSGRKHFCVTAE